MKVVMPIKRKQEKIWKNDLNIIFIIIYLHKNKIFILNKHFFIINKFNFFLILFLNYFKNLKINIILFI